MAKSFYGIDYLILTDIYAASEKPIEGITSAKIKGAYRAGKSVPGGLSGQKRRLAPRGGPGRAGRTYYRFGRRGYHVCRGRARLGRAGRFQRRAILPSVRFGGSFGKLRYQTTRAHRRFNGRIFFGTGDLFEIRHGGRRVVQTSGRRGRFDRDITVRDKEKITSLVRSYNLDVALSPCTAGWEKTAPFSRSSRRSASLTRVPALKRAARALDKVLAQDLFQKSGIQVPAHISLYKQEAAHHAGLIQAIDTFDPASGAQYQS